VQLVAFNGATVKRTRDKFYGSLHLAKTKSRVKRILLNRHELWGPHMNEVKTHAAIGFKAKY